ncbi:MAG: class I adenylate-forming enzyme family protein [Acidimicrobiia bacterium]
MTTAELLRNAAREHPDREAYVQGSRRVTYAELDRMADAMGSTLVSGGVRPGDVVSFLLPSSIEFAAAYAGALRAGAVTSALNLRLGPAEQASIFARTEPRVTVVGDGVTAPAGAGRIVDAEELAGILASEPQGAEFPTLSDRDTACVVWTSGTTGAPKGAVYDHETMAAISRNVGELTHPGDRRLVVLPFAHVGYMTRMWDELANATTIVLVGEPWSATETLRLIRDERITMATGVPTQWQLVLDHADCARTDFSGLRVAGLGAATIPPELVRRMRETLRCPVLTRYTSTEAGVTTSTRVDDPPEIVATTVGRPAPEVDMRIIGPDGAPLPDGEVGEVVCRSPAMMRGYWRDQEATADTIDADGFLHTGDLGFIGADGNLRLVGRLKEMYLRGGYNVYPAEVEGVLADHPRVTRAAVVGVPDPVLGEVGVAFVVPEPDVSPPTGSELRDWCRARLADYKAPDRVEIVDDLPVTSMLKVDKARLLAQAQETAKESA